MSGRLWCRAGEGLGGFGPKPGRERSGEGLGEGSGEGVAGFSAEPGQAQPGEGSREGSIGAEPCRSGSNGFRRRFREGCRECFGEGSRQLWCKARPGFNGFRRRLQRMFRRRFRRRLQRRFRRSSFFPFFCFRACARFRKICKNKRCGCWRYHRSLFLVVFICQEGFLNTSVCSSLCSSTPFLAPSLRLCACAAPL